MRASLSDRACAQVWATVTDDGDGGEQVSQRPLVALLAAVAIVACEPGDGPRPSPTATASPEGVATARPALGLQVAVVLSPPRGVAALENLTIEEAAAQIGSAGGLDVGEVRVLEPPTEPFRRDQLGFAAERGAGLVCTVGADGADDIAAVAPRFPETRFCLLGGTVTDPPPNVIHLDWDRREGAFLAGAAAALSRPDAHVGIVVRSASAGFDDVRTGFEAGARTVRPEVRVVIASVPGDGDDPVGSAAATAEELHAGDPPVRALLSYGDADVAAGAVASFAGDGFLIGWGADLASVLADRDDLPVEDPAEHVVLSVVRSFDLALRAVIAHVTEDEDLPTLGPDAYDLVPGGAEDVHDRVRARLEQLVDDIEAGDVDPGQPPPPPPSPAPS